MRAIDKTSKTVATQRIPIRLSQERGKLVVVASAAALARGEVPVTVALRLFLPESWTNDPGRLKQAGVPIALRTARRKPQIALAEIDLLIAGGVRFGSVLADADYRQSAPFREELTRRNLTWAVGIPRHLKAYPAGVQLIWPVAKRGRPRQRSIPDVLSVATEDMLADAKWRTITWRTGTRQGQSYSCAHGRWTTTADQGQESAASALRGSLAYWRTPRVRREKILPRQPGRRHQPAHIG